MTVSRKAFSSGVSESCSELTENAPAIILAIGTCAAIGFLVGGTPGAWIAAKISSLALGAAFAINPSKLPRDFSSLIDRTSHTAGNVVASLCIPFALVIIFQKFV